MTATFIPAETKDLDVLISLMSQMQADDPWSGPFEAAKARTAVGTLIRDPALGRIWIIAVGDQPIGYIVMTFDYSLEYNGKCAWVDEFFIQKDYRGKGFGSQALRFFEDAARSLGAKTIHLGVHHGNPAIELYRRAGFKKHDSYLMTKWIGGKRG
ncbi:MAG: GNAT family N-acetyltransferase [Acidobacteriia bacterium]|nr:GNAT family N-acetyltransferase [Terriglobia bacterium]